MKGDQLPALRVGEATYDPVDRTVVLDGQEQRLEPRLAEVFDLLRTRAGETVTRQELLEEVWGYSGSDEALTQAISRLRQVFGNRDLIVTEPRKGYRLAVDPVATKVNLPATRAQPVAVPMTGPTLDRDPRRGAFLAGMFAGLLVAALIAAVLWPRPVTVTQKITQRPGEEPVTETTTCEGDQDECSGVIGEMP